MKLIDPQQLDSEWSYPDYEPPLRAVEPAVDNHIDSETYSPRSKMEIWAKNSCKHRITHLERNGFRSRE